MTLRRRLLWLVLAVLLPTAALFVWIVAATYHRETESAHLRLRETTRALSLVIDREIDKRAGMARALAAAPALAQGDLRAFHEQGRAATRGTDSWVVLVDEDDQVLNTSLPFGAPLPRRNWSPDRPLATGDRVEVSNLRIGPVTKKPVLGVFVPEGLRHPARYNVGVVFTPAPLQDILREQRFPEGWVASVLDREHRVVARSHNAERWMGSAVPADLVAALKRGNEGFLETTTLDGVPVAAFYSRSPAHGWSFVMAVPRDIVASAARRAVWEASAGAAVLGVFALALAAWAAQRIRGPISQLEEAARQLERDEVPDLQPTGLAEADAVGTALRRAGLQAALVLSERQQVLDEVRRTEESQRLLVQLHDATRGLRDPVEVQWEIVSRVGRHFGVTRCTYGEIDAAEQSIRVDRDYTDGVASVAGSHDIASFGDAVLDDMKAGRTVIVRDVHTDPRTSEPAVRAAYDGIQARAMLSVPLQRDGRFVAVLVLHHRDARDFSAAEAALLEQVAERTWFAVDSARAESALRESRDVLSLAMRSGKMGAWSRDLLTDRVWWSRELEEIFGLPPGSFAGDTASFRALLHPSDAPAVAAAIAAAVASRQDYTIEFRFRHAGGQWCWMEGRGRAVYGADGRPTMLYGLGIDIDARKHVEEELRRLNEELSEAHRRKDEFLATLAHELRNPLAPITNAIEILRLKDPADAETRWTRDVIDRQVRQMTRLVDDLLDVARITRGKIHLRRERITLAAIVHSAIEAARPFIAASGHELALTLPPEPIWVDADATRLTQVLLNLLNNAAKYTPRGGRIEIEAAARDGEAVIVVRDSGIGIPAEHLLGIFEMFSQVVPAIDRSQGGLGIGLALARGLVALHGGSIEARSGGEGQGSEFEVRLPLAEALPPQAVEPPARDGARAAKLRVLVVDDNRDAAESLAMMLELSGHDTATAHDGPGALGAAPGFRPDVVLLDIGMPGMNGYEVAEHLRQTAPGRHALLVALTGWGQDEDKRRAVAAGFDHHLTKPVDLASLHAVLEAGEARRGGVGPAG
jgi:PAS domain S-box-containing protein